MYIVRVEADFAAAHALTHYHGKCERLHGHNYLVRAYARGALLDEGGMVLDFTIFKGELRTILAELDHTNLNDMAYFAGDPSAERIARWIFDRLEAGLASRGVEASLLDAVEVFETPTSMARWQRDD